MSRRSVPRFDPADLRDHASEERIARVWARIESGGDLPGARSPRAASPRRLVPLLAAALTAFGGGIVAGKMLYGEAAGPTLPAASVDESSTAAHLLAAGSEGRSFPLPGGGQIVLGPRSLVELEQTGAGALTLLLVQGEALIDTAAGARSTPLSVVAGDARLATAAGSVLHVRRSDDHLDVDVTAGLVNVSSPAGSRELGRGQRASAVPLWTLTAALADEVVRPPSPARTRVVSTEEAVDPGPAAGPASVSVAAASPSPDWLSHYRANNVSEALELLGQKPGGVDGAIGSARSAAELMAISDILRAKGKNPSAAIRALTRVVDGFSSDPNAPIAAITLAKMHEKAGDVALAQAYLERARILSPEGALAEDALCKQLRSEMRAGRKIDAARMAQEYVTKYPDGQCRDEAERILAGEDGEDGDGEIADPVEPSADASIAP